MKKFLIVGLMLVLVFGLIGSAATSVTPRTGLSIFLFDNEMGETANGLIIVFEGEVTLDSSYIIAVGGGDVSHFELRPYTRTYVTIFVEVYPSGTLFIPIAEEFEDIPFEAYWF